MTVSYSSNILSSIQFIVVSIYLVTSSRDFTTTHVTTGSAFNRGQTVGLQRASLRLSSSRHKLAPPLRSEDGYAAYFSMVIMTTK
jgi:hypothetical protein